MELILRAWIADLPTSSSDKVVTVTKKELEFVFDTLEDDSRYPFSTFWKATCLALQEISSYVFSTSDRLLIPTDVVEKLKADEDLQELCIAFNSHVEHAYLHDITICHVVIEGNAYPAIIGPSKLLTSFKKRAGPPAKKVHVLYGFDHDTLTDLLS